MERVKNEGRGGEETKERDPYFKILQSHPEEYGLKVQEVMREAKMTPIKVAGQLGISITQLESFTNGLQPVTEDLHQGLCKIFGVGSIRFLPNKVVNELFEKKWPQIEEWIGSNSPLARLLNKSRKRILFPHERKTIMGLKRDFLRVVDFIESRQP